MERLRTVTVSDWLTKISDGDWSFFGLLDRLTKWAFPPTLRLSPLEKRLYAEALSKLPPQAAAAVERQMSEYNLVQRGDWWRQSVFYLIRRGKAVFPFPEELQFPERDRDFKFATMKFKVPGSDTPYWANFWAIGGRFARITFSPEVRDILNRDDIEILKMKVRPAGLIAPLARPPPPQAPDDRTTGSR